MSASASALVSPASFPANRRGYNAYLKALGIDLKDHKQVWFWAMTESQFFAIDRRSIDEKLAEAGAACEKHHDEWLAADRAGSIEEAEAAEAAWDEAAKLYGELCSEKHA